MKMASVELRLDWLAGDPLFLVSTKLEKGGILRLLSAKVRQFSGVETKKRKGKRAQNCIKKKRKERKED